MFRMEMGWFKLEGFKDQLLEVWPQILQKRVLDCGHCLLPCLRRWLRGWSANMQSAQKKRKKGLEAELTEIGKRADERDLFEREWNRRYELEKELENIYIQEEIWWQRRGGVVWLLQGDANTSFFDKSTIERKRKSHIFSLQDGETTIAELDKIKQHV